MDQELRGAGKCVSLGTPHELIPSGRGYPSRDRSKHTLAHVSISPYPHLTFVLTGTQELGQKLQESALAAQSE